MEVTAGEAATVVALEFAVPVPAGNEVILLTIERKDAGFFETSEVEVVVDVTARIVYADYSYWSALHARGWPAFPVTDDPIGALGAGWAPKRAFRGRVAGALLSTRDGGERNHITTLLHVLPEVERSYRT